MTAVLVGPGGEIDVLDRMDRELGHVIIDEMPAVTLPGEIEVKNDTGNPVPISAENLDIALSVLLETLAGAPTGTLEAIRLLLASALTVQGTVGLDVATLGALETINALVSGSVDVSNMIPAVETGLAKDATIATRYAGQKLSAPFTVSLLGDTIVIPAPGVGFKTVVFWVYALTDPDEPSSPLIKISFAGGAEIYRGYAIAHWEPFVGPEDAAVVVNLSGAATVSGTIHYLTVPA